MPIIAELKFYDPFVFAKWFSRHLIASPLSERTTKEWENFIVDYTYGIDNINGDRLMAALDHMNSANSYLNKATDAMSELLKK